MGKRRLVLLAALGLLLLAGCAEVGSSEPTSVTESAATLNATVDPQGAATTYWFEYGTSTAYGSRTPTRSAGAGNGAQRVSEPVTGLRPNTVYHHRLCAAQSEGTECTLDLTFTTRAATATLPAGFRQTTAITGLTQPTAVRFASDGRVFVAEQSGLIKIFDGVGDPTPKIFADLRTQVHAFWDRGLLGIALDPGFPAQPYVYVLYTHDAAPGGTAPRWGVPGQSSDGCPEPPGATNDGCVVGGRLSRLTAAGDAMSGPERVLVEGWCQQFPSHTVGSLAFTPDGALIATAGDGASFNFADVGQRGNPCGDPGGPAGADLTPPTAEGGALRSQDLRTGGDPTGLSGTVIRVDPATGAGLPGNPLAGSSDANARRIIAQGLRNPFRMVVRPGTSEVWLGDVGWGTWEEINRIPNPADATLENFGWPCYEGGGRQAGYEALGTSLCAGLYGSPGAVTAPFFAYRHGQGLTSDDGCARGASSISGIAFQFYAGGPYPPAYDGALFFADYARNCIWVMQRSGGGGLPVTVRPFVTGAATPVDLQLGPGGDLFYVDAAQGTVRRVEYVAGNTPPNAVATATPAAGDEPLTVTFDGSGSTDPEAAGPLAYAWDLDGDGAFDDATDARPSRTFTTPGRYTATLRVTDAGGATDTATAQVAVGGPTARIAAPAAGTRWRVGDLISFTGSATDPQDGTLPASALSWSLVLQHCPEDCHAHDVQRFEGAAGGQFTAPDHTYPSHLELRLTATDSDGLQDTETLELQPQTVELTLRSTPEGRQLDLNGSTATAPFTRTVIAGSTAVLTAPTPNLGGTTFVSWSDGGARSHSVTATTNATYTATFRAP